MIGVGFLRCFFIVGVMSWYTTSVWKTIDQYFRDQFRDYLQKEFETNAAMRKDMMLEAERQAIQKALINKIGKMGFSKPGEDNDGRGDTLLGQDQLEQAASEVVSEYLLNEYKYPNSLMENGVTLASESHGDPVGTNANGEATERIVVGEAVTTQDEWTGEISETEEIYEFQIKEHQPVEILKPRYEISEEECILKECEDGAESKKEPQNWKNFLEDDEVCRFEDFGQKNSCEDP